MRLFVATDLGKDTQAQIRSVREQLEPLLRTRRPPRMTWVKDEMAHVTLRFIGEVPDECAVEIESALNSDLALAPFDVAWDRLGTFPAGRSPRVVWIGASTGVDALSNLARMVNLRLNSMIGPADARPFKAHVTIGRVRDPGKVDWRLALTRVELDPTVTRVDHVTLYRSHLSPRGPTYSEVVRTMLV